jgi:DNA-binding response OmpR family regulator
MGASLLIIEDEAAIADFLAENLRQDDHDVETAGSVGDAMRRLERERPAIAVIDVGLPDGSGFDLCRRIRAGEAGDPEVGIIMLTARAEEQDRVRGFARGADDYVVKPFHYPELLARINALHLRLTGARRADRIVAGPVEIDLVHRSVQVHGSELTLPSKEYELLVVLARDPLRVFEKRELMERIWGYRHASSTRTLDSHASRLRRRLDALAPGETLIVNRWSIGYSFQPVN